MEHSSSNVLNCPVSKGLVIPITIDKALAKKCSLFCQTDDTALSLSGELGAIGRITSSSNCISLDLKGDIYKGEIYSTSTIFTLSLKNVSRDGQDNMEAKITSLTNEICHFKKSNDKPLQDYQHYSDDESLNQKNMPLKASEAQHKKRKEKNQSDDDSNESASNDGEQKRGKKATSTKSIISTITRKVRTKKSKTSRKRTKK